MLSYGAITYQPTYQGTYQPTSHAGRYGLHKKNFPDPVLPCRKAVVVFRK